MSEAVDQTFVFADLSGFTALTEAHGDDYAADVAADFSAAVRALLDEYGAVQVKAIGDGLLLRVLDAGRAAHLAARVVAESGRHRSLGVRVGMHTGTAVQRGGDWFGAAVNLAARVAESARSGEALMTGATRDAAGDALSSGQVVSRGRRALKNVSQPVELVALVLEDGRAGRLPVDPVCRMAVDPSQSHERVVHRGVEYHFCSSDCREAFTRDPRRYTRIRSHRDELLVSDRARERAARALSRAYDGGRLTSQELEDRIEQVWRGRTRADLKAATRDLPYRRRRQPWRVLFAHWLGTPGRRLPARRRQRRLHAPADRDRLRR
jgi:class 3 adenylate cyclase/YHS domain-containing protein